MNESNKIIHGILLMSSFLTLIILAFLKTYRHPEYQKLKRGEKSRGILNYLDFSLYMIPDYFVTFPLFYILKKNKNIELDLKRRTINRMVTWIYISIALMIATILAK